MTWGLIMIIVSTLPSLLSGLVFAAFASPDVVPPEVFSDPRIAEAGFTPELLLSAMRVGGVIVLVTAVLYLLFAVLAFRGRNWARIVLTVMTAVFAGLLLLGLLGGGAADPAGLVLVLVVLGLSVGGTILMYSPPAARYFAGRPTS